METFIKDLTYEIVKDLPFEEILNYCQAYRNTKQALNLCNSASFWVKVGKYKFPEITPEWEDRIKNKATSLGKFYRNLADVLSNLRDLVMQHTLIGLEIQGLTIIPAAFINSILDKVELVGRSAKLKISIAINGNYIVRNGNVLTVLTPYEFNLFLMYILITARTILY